MDTITNKTPRDARKAASWSLPFALMLTALGSAQVAAQASASKPETGPATEVVLMSEVKWTPLNPLRGDASPQAGTLWGDRAGRGPTGFLVRFKKGFSSPPHIHNVSYRGVVIRGLVHNDDPKAAEMWMPKGSFWTQPAGEVHITAAKGGDNVAYIEIGDGPYLVRPPKQAFDNGERPINVHASNIVWIDPPGMKVTAKGPKIAFLWGKPQDDRLNGSLVKLPAGFSGNIRSHGASLRAVVIQGRPRYGAPGKTDAKQLEPGSYFGSNGKAMHPVSCRAGDDCIIYVRMKGTFDVVSAQR